MALSAGDRLGPYEIVAPLGEGGMGEVYQARDTRLHRTVAVKVLRGQSEVPAARERFLREARAASALSHPNICAVFDIGESEGAPYLVMEYLEGQTLRQRLSQGPLEAAAIAELGIQIAGALEAAHGQGIVHRDIKAANIFVTRQSHIKVMDFGVAKVLDRPLDEDDATLTAGPLTEPGAAVGTVTSMSPEQARGLPVDARTDLFATGVVLYEMATGRSPFRGATTAVVFEAILNRNPEAPRSLRPDLPVRLEEIILTALEKDREVRVQSAAELRAALLRVKRELDTGQTAAAVTPKRSRAWIEMAVLGALLVLAVAGWLIFRHGAAPPAGPTEWVALTNFADSAVAPSLSPDGKYLAFIRGENTFEGPGDVYIKQLPNGDPVALTHDGGLKMGPTHFSSDGSRIGFSVGALYATTVPMLGGEARRILNNGGGFSWIDQAGARKILYSKMTGEGIHMGIFTSTEGKEDERQVYVPADVNGMAHRSYLSPDGKWVLLVEMDISGWLPCRVVPFDGSSAGKQVGPSPAQCTDGAWSPDGKWVYLAANPGNGYHIWRQKFPDGAPEQVTNGATDEQGLDFAPDGRSFVTSVGDSQSTLWVHDATGDRQVTSEGYAYLPTFSADGKKLYYLQRSRANRRFVSGELWVSDLESGKRERLLPDSLVEHYSIAPDGNRIAYLMLDDNGRATLWEAALDGSATPHRISELDGVRALYASNGDLFFVGGARSDLALYRRKSGAKEFERVLPAVFLYDVSPDCQWAAVWQGSSVVVHQVDGPDSVVICARCATAGEENRGVTPPLVHWARDGKKLYLHSGLTRETYAVPLSKGAMVPAIPKGGWKDTSDAAGLAGVHTMGQKRAFVPGDGSVYAYPRVTVHRNIYRIPVH